MTLARLTYLDGNVWKATEVLFNIVIVIPSSVTIPPRPPVPANSGPTRTGRWPGKAGISTRPRHTDVVLYWLDFLLNWLATIEEVQ